jgi:hypothetical protein
MPREWNRLNEFGRREYKFAQRDSFDEIRRQVGNDFDSGVCMGVTVDWIYEKLTTSNGLFRQNGPLLAFVPRHFSNTLNPLKRLKQGISPSGGSMLAGRVEKGKSGKRNEATMFNGALNHLAYRRGDVRALENILGFVKSEYEAQPSIYKGPHPAYSTILRVADSIADAAIGLPKGEALLIEVEHTKTKEGEPGSGGHAIAFYKSRGNTLYFFDSNAGTYQIPSYREKIGRNNLYVAKLMAEKNSRVAKSMAEKRRAVANAGESPSGSTRQSLDDDDNKNSQDDKASDLETNALGFVKCWISIYDNASGHKWKLPKLWCRSYRGARPKYLLGPEGSEQ